MRVTAAKSLEYQPRNDEIEDKVSCACNPKVDVMNATECGEEADECTRNPESCSKPF
jgi:hypothetical protein